MDLITVLDFETSFQIKNKKKDPTPYDSRNFLVSYGILCSYSNGVIEKYYQCLTHNQKQTDEGSASLLRKVIADTNLLIAFNAKFELSWLKSIGIEYTGKIFDPMIAAYVLARGQKLSMSLEDCCIRFDVDQKKSDLVKQYMKDNVSFEDIPWNIVEEYGRQDVLSTWSLYKKLVEELDKSPYLWPTVDLMNEFCQCLTDIEFNGIKIDVNILNDLEVKYRKEYNELEIVLRKLAQEAMGDTIVNINSPEQLSQLLYSRKVNDKPKWKQIFNLGTELRGSVVKPKYPPKMSSRDFVDVVRNNTSVIYKTKSENCQECRGSGRIGSASIQRNIQSRKCRTCLGQGVCFSNTTEIAGFKLTPQEAKEAAIGGFSTDKLTIERLGQTATGPAKIFLDSFIRYSKADTYLNTFVLGIKDSLIKEYIHTSFMQCVTATGRLSSRNPNFQNQPRGSTFEVKRCIVSRFPDGVITEADAKQLEFRIAGELSGDKQIAEDVIKGIDVHANTAKATGLSRQDSKPHTFAPVYGAMAQGKPPHIAAYYEFFKSHYHGLCEAHERWAESVLAKGGLFRLPSGREYYYPNTKRFYNGGISNSTIIKNYPVQGHATGDLIPVWAIECWKLIKHYKLLSKLILTVHDSLITDSPKEEKKIILDILHESWYNATKIQPKIRWNYEYKIPLDIEIKQGANWLEMKDA
jgi:DNA polymerase I-like protein with 3'-5' exonuclease and polymerase domains